MKILQINCVYGKGSTGRITQDIHWGLKDRGIDSIVCYGRGEELNEQNIYKCCPEFYAHFNHAVSLVTGVMYGGCAFSTARIIKLIKKEAPDVVHLHCINGYFVNIYRLVRWLRDNGIKTLLTLHAEFMYTGGCGYALDCELWRQPGGCANGKCPQLKKETGSLFLDGTGRMWQRMYDVFRGFDHGLIIASVSPWLMERAAVSPIMAGKQHRVIYNGLDDKVFHPWGDENARALREELGIGDKKVIFHASPDFTDEPQSIKGGRYVIELAKAMPDVCFLVAGRCKEGICVPGNMRVLGHVNQIQRLAELYSMADVTVLASQKETFSMVTAESLCCGTPVAGFKAGAPEQIALPEYSRFVDYGDIKELEKTIRELIVLDIDKTDLQSQCKIYSRENMIDSYFDAYKELTGEA